MHGPHLGWEAAGGDPGPAHGLRHAVRCGGRKPRRGAEPPRVLFIGQGRAFQNTHHVDPQRHAAADLGVRLARPAQVGAPLAGREQGQASSPGRGIADGGGDGGGVRLDRAHLVGRHQCDRLLKPVLGGREIRARSGMGSVVETRHPHRGYVQRFETPRDLAAALLVHARQPSLDRGAKRPVARLALDAVGKGLQGLVVGAVGKARRPGRRGLLPP